MIFPPLLNQGDKIAIVAPAGKLMESDLVVAQKTLSEWGLEVVFGRHVNNHFNYFAGNDHDRLADLQWSLDDPTVAAVLFARGGYGATRIIDNVDFTRFKKIPKWLIGFSDITAIHLKLQSLGVAGIHGPMATSFGKKDSFNSIEALKKLLINGNLDLVSALPSHRGGVVEGEMTGGNLALVTDSLGTLSEVDAKNKILFLEEVGEKTYRVDRMLRQLYRAGKLDNLAGLIIGHFSSIEEGETPFGQSWREVIEEITKPFTYPVAFGFNIGHEPENRPIIIGGRYKLNAGDGGSILTQLDSF